MSFHVSCTYPGMWPGYLDFSTTLEDYNRQPRLRTPDVRDQLPLLSPTNINCRLMRRGRRSWKQEQLGLGDWRQGLCRNGNFPDSKDISAHPKFEIPLASSFVSLKSILKMYVWDQSRWALTEVVLSEFFWQNHYLSLILFMVKELTSKKHIQMLAGLAEFSSQGLWYCKKKGPHWMERIRMPTQSTVLPKTSYTSPNRNSYFPYYFSFSAFLNSRPSNSLSLTLKLITRSRIV